MKRLELNAEQFQSKVKHFTDNAPNGMYLILDLSCYAEDLIWNTSNGVCAESREFFEFAHKDASGQVTFSLTDPRMSEEEAELSNLITDAVSKVLDINEYTEHPLTIVLDRYGYIVDSSYEPFLGTADEFDFMAGHSYVEMGSVPRRWYFCNDYVTKIEMIAPKDAQEFVENWNESKRMGW